MGQIARAATSPLRRYFSPRFESLADDLRQLSDKIDALGRPGSQGAEARLEAARREELGLMM